MGYRRRSGRRRGEVRGGDPKSWFTTTMSEIVKTTDCITVWCDWWGAALQTFAPGGKCPRAATEMYHAVLTASASVTASVALESANVVAMAARRLAAENARSRRWVERLSARHSLSNQGSDGRCRRSNCWSGSKYGQLVFSYHSTVANI